MADKNPEVDFFFAKKGQWQEAYKALRPIILGCGLTEELKWGKPCYTLDGGNVVLIHGFKDYCALLFHKGALLDDPKGILVQQTENVQSARQVRFTDVQQIAKLEATLKRYVKKAIEIEKAGLKVEFKESREFAVAEEFQVRLDQDHSLKAAFEALTPGRQRAYLLYFSGAKQVKTREARVEKCIPKILDGLGLDDEELPAAKKKSSRAKRADDVAPTLLSGGNPQIAKGYGNETVQSYIAAMPEWKRDVGERLDTLIECKVPKVRKAVKWNSPLYGVEEGSWFLSFHCFAKYIKVAFFRGASLKPVPPVESKSNDTRYVHIHEHDTIDEKQLGDWILQASRLPGERM